MSQLQFPWYAVRVRTRAEQLTGSFLKGKGYEVFCPSQAERRRYASGSRLVTGALFPGYLFCRLNMNLRLPVLTTPGVSHIVAFDGFPAAIPEREIASILAVVQAGIPAKPFPYVASGQWVRIEDGPLAGLEGMVVRHRGNERLVLSVDILQRSVCVEVENGWVRSGGAVAVHQASSPLG